MSQVVEIVQFKLNEGITEQDFMSSNDEFEKFLYQQSGMLYRSLCKSSTNGTYTDIVYWQTMEQAKTAQQAFFDSEFCKQFMICIDKESVIMDHLDILAQTQCEEQTAAS
ncbi:hypothetical protein [Pseudoalteromonas denitrificans]|uniref:ABM domain-containing protein n=1 Tax=Pseudoalteromonas denitrificans DSM 6059 TaxID=1123010 RepID=A0A1I1U9F3_9GAMM|nr:hypothetical protein [Pseudoalteromonas denitrificans]SFD67314.1 hypothetical protein SAMN02745724_05154 [Pseudoalteromonas denitrificans DSM 6059]